MPLLMSAFTPKATIGLQSLHVRSGSFATDPFSASGGQCPLCPKGNTARRGRSQPRCQKTPDNGHAA